MKVKDCDHEIVQGVITEVEQEWLGVSKACLWELILYIHKIETSCSVYSKVVDCNNIVHVHIGTHWLLVIISLGVVFCLFCV